MPPEWGVAAQAAISWRPSQARRDPPSQRTPLRSGGHHSCQKRALAQAVGATAASGARAASSMKSKLSLAAAAAFLGCEDAID
eukprot:CAMPEP_0185575776 /NCGR_PEP_ID=MMETSP0434-20130131/6867_1 /TAXON_ID=626734 ORGANISM="Favella taraikaensis, Strain Fe Narragansett Bay" /NCGR_SAMPLE_ID=MMETSP0434 /ASSEMBLY_ACC=CAM_ASM_000379 /LENGTH=82 /DNA_ID=CAMNT_0028192741 /DNA_START=2554 /DNA_END=2802 /DNA_ORIENTATION=+